MSPKTSSVSLFNGRVVLPSVVIERGFVLLQNGTIYGVGEHNPGRTYDGMSLDLHGATLYPGFIDVHIHGAVGVDVMEASSSDLRKVSEFLSSQGVTAWLPTLVPGSDVDYQNVVRAVEEALGQPNRQAARILGLHYEGPFVNSAQCGALRTKYFKTYQPQVNLDPIPVPRIPECVRMTTVAPEIDGGLDLIRDLHKRGWVISIGHTRADVEVLDQAFTAGAHHMTHFMNAMPQVHHRKPGPVGWGLSREDVTCDIIADGIHLDKFILRLLTKLKGSRQLCLISDAIAAAGRGDGDYKIWGETIAVREGRTSNASGSIAGSVITMLDAVRMMLSLGISEIEVAQMASLNPARLLKLDQECGSIEEGKRADLVALDQNGKVRLTVVGGEIVYGA